MSQPSKEFSRAEYRRQVAWADRIRREAPFLESFLERASAGTPPGDAQPAACPLLDAGCGTGEHARFLAERGHRVLGLDPSGDAVREARRAAPDGNPLWVRGDLRRLPIEAASLRAVICLGNTLVILGEDEGILAALREVWRVLRPGGGFLVQILNYARLRDQGVRHLPLNFRRDPGEPSELLYLRLMDFEEPRHVSFHVITLERRPGVDEVMVLGAVRRRLRSLAWGDLKALLGEAGFREIRLHGDYQGAPFDPERSADVIAVGWR